MGSEFPEDFAPVYTNGLLNSAATSVARWAKKVQKDVGSRVRMRRMMLAMSQGKLGDALDLTFQHVQKYEKRHQPHQR